MPAKTAKSAAKKKTAPKKAAPKKPSAKPQMSAQDAPAPFYKTMENPMKNAKSFEKLTQDATAMSQEQMDAFMKSTQIFTKGMEDMMKICMDMAQSSAAKNQEAAQSLMACKTLNELTEMQTKLAQNSFDEFMSGATKMSEMSIKVATDAMEPMNDQMTKAMKKASDTMAA